MIAVSPGILNDGANVLAIHGLNSDSSGSDFLLVSELTVQVMDTTGVSRAGYFDTPTPGAANSGGQAAGPAFIGVTDQPDRPVAGIDLVITATGEEVAAAVASISMFYCVMFAFTIRLQQNGEFLGGMDPIEDPDDIYLDRVGLNREGALYKLYYLRLEKVDISKLTYDDSFDASGNTTID